MPDGNGPYTLVLRCVTQAQDVSLKNGTTVDVPYRFLDYFAADLTYRLAVIHKPELAQARKADAVEAWNIASGADNENVPMIIGVMNGHYYR